MKTTMIYRQEDIEFMREGIDENGNYIFAIISSKLKVIDL